VIQNTVEFLRRVNPLQNQKISSPEIESHVKFVEKSLAESYQAAIEDKREALGGESDRRGMKHLRSSVQRVKYPRLPCVGP
jgi:hypothetical protein